ncbi:mitochondrial antiviral-signaling protein [Ornithorhynchus anatinus]|uniref:mitochondrial antiviral-signaling protein n=1 Tax=Ornithorhynchus anatinus TaxID=9258 RepID=UPI000454457E|nr:mitochondrial antiviral-signaling protein [Ornithorhynchus anatinus]
MSLAEEKMKKYIRENLTRFHRIRVKAFLSHLPCLTTVDQEEIRAHLEHEGNQNTVFKLFDHLRCRRNWVTCLIQALEECEYPELAEEVQRVYTSFLPQSQPRAAPFPAGDSASRTSRRPCTEPPVGSGTPEDLSNPQPAPIGSRAAHNGYPEENELSPPIQETKLQEARAANRARGPAVRKEVPEDATPVPPPSSSRPPDEAGPQHAPLPAPSPKTAPAHPSGSPLGQREPNGGVRAPVSAPVVLSVPVSPCKPVSPPISLRPPSNPVPWTVGSRPRSVDLNISPPAGPTSGLGREEGVTLPRPADALQDAKQRGGMADAAKVTPTTPHPGTPQPVPARGPVSNWPAVQPGAGASAGGLNDAEELSKPGVLLSAPSADRAPPSGGSYSGGTERLDMSASGSLSGGPLMISRNRSSVEPAPSEATLTVARDPPEENDYFSMPTGLQLSEPPPPAPGISGDPSLDTLETLHMDEHPKSSLPLGSILERSLPRWVPGPPLTSRPLPPEQQDGPARFWGPWVGPGVAVALISVALAVLYRHLRR